MRTSICLLACGMICRPPRTLSGCKPPLISRIRRSRISTPERATRRTRPLAREISAPRASTRIMDRLWGGSDPVKGRLLETETDMPWEVLQTETEIVPIHAALLATSAQGDIVYFGDWANVTTTDAGPTLCRLYHMDSQTVERFAS